MLQKFLPLVAAILHNCFDLFICFIFLFDLLSWLLSDLHKFEQKSPPSDSVSSSVLIYKKMLFIYMSHKWTLISLIWMSHSTLTCTSNDTIRLIFLIFTTKLISRIYKYIYTIKKLLVLHNYLYLEFCYSYILSDFKLLT